MKRLKKLRIEKNYNQDRMAMELNVSQTTISAFETGERDPDAAMIIRIAKFFNVSSDYLLELSDARLPLTEKDLSIDETKLLHIYRRLNKLEKEKAMAYTQGVADR